MFIVMVLIAHAAGEWVEISQQHYRKPINNNYNIQAMASEEYYQETASKPNRVYDNHSVTEYAWNKGSVDKVPKLGNVQRVQLNTNVVKAPIVRGNVKKSDHNQKFHDIRGMTEVDEDRIYFKDSFAHEDNPFLNHDYVENKFETQTQNGFMNEANRHKSFTESVTRNTAHRIRKPYEEGSQSTINIPVSNKPNNIYKEHVTDKYKDDVFNIKPFNDNVSTEMYSTSSFEIFTDLKRVHNPDKENQFNKTISHINKKKINAFSMKVDHTTQTSVESLGKPKYAKETAKGSLENNKGDRTYINPLEEHSEEHVPNENVDEAIESPVDKKNTMENVLQFMKIVADTIRKNTRRSVNSKTKYLENLRDTILANIEQRIDSAWPDDEELVATASRQRRDTVKGRGHLEVPSSESALMTISFLTFAVFLIKLVLQVIQTYKNKAMMLSPTVMATVGRVAIASKQQNLKP